MDNPPLIPVTFTVTERFVNVHVNGVSICQFGMNAQNQPVLAFPNKYALIALQMVDGPIVTQALVPIRSDMVFQETEPDMALPRYRRTKIEPPRPPGSPLRIRVPEGGKVSKRDVEDVVDRLVRSLVAEPNQSASRRAGISREIAAETGIPVMSIAGIRAALTKNMYGDLEDMKRSMAKTLQG